MAGGNALETFSPTPEKQVSNSVEASSSLISQNDCHGTFGKPADNNAAAVSARESAIAPGGAINFGAHEDIYGDQAGGQGHKVENQRPTDSELVQAFGVTDAGLQGGGGGRGGAGSEAPPDEVGAARSEAPMGGGVGGGGGSGARGEAPPDEVGAARSEAPMGGGAGGGGDMGAVAPEQRIEATNQRQRDSSESNLDQRSTFIDNADLVAQRFQKMFNDPKWQGSDEDKQSLLRDCIGGLNRDLGLPPLTDITFHGNRSADGSYSPATGEMNINAEGLNKDPKELMSTVVHELTHHEQFSRAVCRLADQLQVGSTASEEQVKQISDRMPNFKPDSEQIQNIIRFREGRPLNADQARSADEMLKELASKYPEYQARESCKLAVGNVFLMIDKLKEGGDLQNQYDNLARSSNQSSKLLQSFLQRNPSLKQFIDNQKTDDQGNLQLENDASANGFRENFIKTLNPILEKETDDLDMHTNNYENWFWERNARNSAAAVVNVFQANETEESINEPYGQY